MSNKITLIKTKKITDKVSVAKVQIDDIKIPNFYVGELTETVETLKFKKPYSSYKDGSGVLKYSNPIWPVDANECRQKIWDNIQSGNNVRKTGSGGYYVDVEGNFNVDLMITTDNKVIWPNKIDEDDKASYLIPIKKEDREAINEEVLRQIEEAALVS